MTGECEHCHQHTSEDDNQTQRQWENNAQGLHSLHIVCVGPWLINNKHVSLHATY